MASSYTNDLRLNEMATGDASGTWGDTTNTNLELIAEAFSYGTEAITTNADTHTTTIADGATDPGRSMFLKYTGTLDSTCTITIGPNTVSKLWIIENGTSGSQSIIISQGSGATVTIPSGKTKVIYSDGAGSGGAMVDAFASLNLETSGIIETSASIQTALIEYTDGDDAMTIADGGQVTFAQNIIGTLGTAAQTNITSVGALDGGSITSGFGSIDVGSSAITTTGTVTGNTLAGTLSTAAQPNITSVGTLSSLTVSGDATFDTNTLYVDSTNNRVGIGTTSPKTTLNLAANNSGQGPILTLENTDTTITTSDVVGQIDFYGNDGSTGGTGQKATIQAVAENSSGTSVGLTFGTSPFPTTTATERMRIDASGNVGIGTDSPAYKIDSRVSTSASIVAGLNLDASGNSNGDGSAINFSRASNVLSSVAKISAVKAEVSNNETDLVFSNYAAGSLTEKMRIIGATGRVGIGTDSPSSVLEVTGTGDADTGILTTHSRSGVGYTLRLNNTNNGANKGSGIKWSSGGFDTGAIIVRSDAVAASGDAPAYMTFHTSADGTEGVNERMRIDSSGNVKIKTTDDYYANDLVVNCADNGGMTLVGGTSDVQYLMFADGTSGDQRYRGYIEYSHNSDHMAFASAGTEKMRIDSSGNLLVGTTSALLSNRALQVKANGGNDAAVIQSTSVTAKTLLCWNNATSGDNQFIGFLTEAGGTQRGLIDYDRASGQVRYNITSDARLKDNIQNAPESGSLIDSIQVRQYDLKETSHHVGFGFIAQELLEVTP